MYQQHQGDWHLVYGLHLGCPSLGALGKSWGSPVCMEQVLNFEGAEQHSCNRQAVAPYKVMRPDAGAVNIKQPRASCMSPAGFLQASHGLADDGRSISKCTAQGTLQGWKSDTLDVK